MTWPAFLLVLSTVGCGSNRSAPPVPVPTSVPAPVPAPDLSPAALYADCALLVEGPQADAECTTDADCGRGGCGNVVCTTAVAATDVMTTCEDRPCFAVLDACGCHDGRCTWTVRPPASPAP